MKTGYWEPMFKSTVKDSWGARMFVSLLRCFFFFESWLRLLTRYPGVFSVTAPSEGSALVLPNPWEWTSMRESGYLDPHRGGISDLL